MKKIISRFLPFMAFLLVSSGLFGQEINIFTKLELDERSLTTAQNENYQILKSSGTFLQEGTEYVSFGNLSEGAATGNIKIAISGNSCGREFIFNGRSVQFASESSYTWYGELEQLDANPCTHGSILITCTGGVKNGHIQISDVHYEITDLSGGVLVLMKVDPIKFSQPNECGVSSSTPVGNDEGGDGNVLDGECTTTVLVVYTAKAKAAVPNMSALISTAIGQFNTAVSNSAVPAAKCNLVLAGSQQVNFVETTSMAADVNSLANNTTIQNLRNQFAADIVVLMTNGNYGGSLGRVQAIGPSNAGAYAIVQTSNATSTFTFAHEVGHLFGCRHNNDPTAGFPHGHNFQSGGLKKTIMNVLYEPSGGTRVLHFSNPSVPYGGVSTGITNLRDNAKQLKEKGCTVASFRGYVPPSTLSVAIVGPPFACKCDVVDFDAIVSGGTLPYQYQWQVSVNGINWSGPVLGNGSSFSFQLPCTANVTRYVKVRVQSADGQVKEKIKPITTKNPPCNILP